MNITKAKVLLAAVLILFTFVGAGIVVKTRPLIADSYQKRVLRMREYREKEGLFIGLPWAENLNRWFKEKPVGDRENEQNRRKEKAGT